MADLIEDQKIHYIVKDYRRMYNQHNELVQQIEELKEELVHRNNEIKDLKKQVANLSLSQPKKPSGPVKGAINEIEAKTNSVANSLKKHIDSLNGILKNIEELRTFINA